MKEKTQAYMPKGVKTPASSWTGLLCLPAPGEFPDEEAAGGVPSPRGGY